MAQECHYRIDYFLNGAHKTFYIRAGIMNNSEAWHWATVDAGVGQLPKYRTDPIHKLKAPSREARYH